MKIFYSLAIMLFFSCNNIFADENETTPQIDRVQCAKYYLEANEATNELYIVERERLIQIHGLKALLYKIEIKILELTWAIVLGQNDKAEELVTETEKLKNILKLETANLEKYEANYTGLKNRTDDLAVQFDKSCADIGTISIDEFAQACSEYEELKDNRSCNLTTDKSSTLLHF